MGAASAIRAGDEVVAVRHVAELVALYGERAAKPWIVERIVRQPRYAASGGGIMAWRSNLRRVRSAYRIAKDVAKAAP